MNKTINELVGLKQYVDGLIESVLYNERSERFDAGYKYGEDPKSYTNSPSAVRNRLKDIGDENNELGYTNVYNPDSQEFIKGVAASSTDPKLHKVAKDVSRDLRQQEYMARPGLFGIKQHTYDDAKGAIKNIPNNLKDFSKTPESGYLAAGTAAAGLGVAGYAAYKLAKKRKAEKEKANKK